MTNRDPSVAYASVSLVCLAAPQLPNSGFIALARFIILNSTWRKPHRKSPLNQLLMEFEFGGC